MSLLLKTIDRSILPVKGALSRPVFSVFCLLISGFILLTSSLAQANACIDGLSARSKFGKVQLVWTHVADTQKYDILRSLALSGPYSEIAETQSTYSTYLDTSVDNGVLYYYRIRQRSTAGQDCLSDSIAAMAPARRLRMKRVPMIEGLTQALADNSLLEANLTTGNVGQIASHSTPPGHVVTQDPPVNSFVPKSYPIDYLLSTGAIALLSPQDGQTIRYNNVTLEVATENFTRIKARNLSALDAYDISGVSNGLSTYLYRLPLVEGENTIALSAINTVGETSTQQVLLTSENINFIPLGIKTSVDEGFETVTTDISAIKPFPYAGEYLLDNESDGIIDSRNTTGSFTVTYDSVGRYQPQITVRTIDNILYTNDSTLGSPVTVKTKPQITGLASITDSIVDLEKYDGTIYALAWNKFYKISTEDETNIESIDVPGISDPQGLSIDQDGNVFIADTGNNRIVKLLKSTRYGLDTSLSADGSFGSPGIGDGQFDQPRDVSVHRTGDQQEIYVLDAANNRVQLFDSTGSYVTQFDGSTTPGGKLNNPLNMIGAPNLMISDSGNSVIREIGLSVDGSVHENFSIPLTYEFGKMTDASPGISVPDVTNDQLNIMYSTGEILKQIELQDTPAVALAYNQNNSILSASGNVAGLANIEIELDPPGSTPTDLVKLFIQAYKDDDREFMLELTGNQPKYIDLLNQSRNRVLEAFNNITGLTENINGELSGVTVNFQLEGNDASLQFELFRYQDKWLIRDIL